MKSSFRRVLEIILWSGVTNVVLLTAFFVGLSFHEFRSSLAELRSGMTQAGLQQARPSWAVTAASILGVMPSGPAQNSSPVQPAERGDLQLVLMNPQVLKGSLEPVAVTSVEKSDDSESSDADVSAESAAEEVAAEVIDGEAPFDVVGPEGEQAQSLSPVLRMNRKSGKLEIGNFETVSLTGGASQCLEMGYTLLGDAGAPETELKVLAQTSMITMARICTSNGSVVITCRSDQVTISPRRLKPNESCTS